MLASQMGLAYIAEHFYILFWILTHKVNIPGIIESFSIRVIWGCLPWTKIYLKFIFHSQNIKGRLPFTKVFEVIFHLQKYLRSSSIYKIFEVVFHLYNIWGCHPLSNNLRLSSISKLFEVVFHLQNIWGRLPFTKYLRSSSIK